MTQTHDNGPYVNHPGFNHWNAAGDLRLKATPGFERDALHLQAQIGPLAATLRLDREARAWLRRWCEYVDAEAQPEEVS
jgi:hypothetical protein